MSEDLGDLLRPVEDRHRKDPARGLGAVLLGVLPEGAHAEEPLHEATGLDEGALSGNTDGVALAFEIPEGPPGRHAAHRELLGQLVFRGEGVREAPGGDPPEEMLLDVGVLGDVPRHEVPRSAGVKACLYRNGSRIGHKGARAAGRTRGNASWGQHTPPRAAYNRYLRCRGMYSSLALNIY